MRSYWNFVRANNMRSVGWGSDGELSNLKVLGGRGFKFGKLISVRVLVLLMKAHSSSQQSSTLRTKAENTRLEK